MKKILFTFYFLGSVFVHSQCFTSIGSGYYNNMGIKSNGTLWGWGSGASGQLGNGTVSDYWTPVQIGAVNSWQSINSGDYITFALRTNGSLWTAGANYAGQLGIGSTVSYITTLTQVGTATNWQQVVSGGAFTLGLKTNGTLWGWGQNDTYQMGDGSCCSNRLSPGQIGTATDWKMVGATGTSTAVALKTNGTMWGWGQNLGILGPSTLSAHSTPTQLNPDTDWATMSLGAGHILALKTNGTLWSWGVGGQGQTGDNLPPAYFRDVPVQIGNRTWINVDAGYKSSYGIQSDGTLWAWGWNNMGQLGDGTTTDRMQPVQIGADTNWVAVSAGYQHVVALKSDGSLWAWGRNNYGQIGNGTTNGNITPVNVAVNGCTLDIPDFEREEMVLSPNPAQSELGFTYQGKAVVDEVVIYDLTGRRVYSSRPVAGIVLQAALPIGQLQRGTYLLSLLSAGQTVVGKKFVKE